MKVTMIIIVICEIGTISEELVNDLVDLEIRCRANTTPCIIITFGRNTEKRPGNLRRITVFRTPVSNDQLKPTDQ